MKNVFQRQKSVFPPSTLYAASVKNNRQSQVSRSADNSPRIERQRVHSQLIKNRSLYILTILKTRLLKDHINRLNISSRIIKIH